MRIQPRAAKVPRLWLLLPLSLCRARTSSGWLLVIRPCVRWWSAAHQRRICSCSWERRVAVLPLSLAALAICETRDRDVEGYQILLLDHRE